MLACFSTVNLKIDFYGIRVAREDARQVISKPAPPNMSSIPSAN